MLFRKKIEPSCGYCRFGKDGEDDMVICVKKGIMQPWQKCRSFEYDPLRRVPEAQPLPKTDIDPDSFRL